MSKDSFVLPSSYPSSSRQAPPMMNNDVSNLTPLQRQRRSLRNTIDILDAALAVVERDGNIRNSFNSSSRGSNNNDHGPRGGGGGGAPTASGGIPKQ
eukprot:CAMPEP_0178852036 /NCGR_PEP_ID=MMETSP0746-20121128/21448_1 /TAXON_ID=913974 /ORGANISM="Nitzschia punctata, Strain CCMP561" /LENGTH=96 /DNA_ID=CAMNT_0020517655 /DNA_START=28 /DNA_END=318 /DNA_ORIENTATION=-